MNANSSPLIQELTPERFAGWMLNFIDAGYKGLLVKNGQVVGQLEPGRYLNFAMPWLEQCKLLLVDIKARNLEVASRGDFLSRDQFIVNVSLNVTYQVLDVKRVALQLSEPLTLLGATLKDLMGMAIAMLEVQDLITLGRTQIRDYLLTHPEDIYQLGFQLEDVRVNDITFPEKRGILRQAEGMSARQEASYQAELQKEIAKAGQPQVNLISGGLPPETGVTIAQLGDAALTPGKSAATELVLNAAVSPADKRYYSLMHQQTGQQLSLSESLTKQRSFTLGREPGNDLLIQDSQCSRHHAQITQEQEIFYLTDLGSANGTYLNGMRLLPQQPTPLEAGAVLQIGTQSWQFREKPLE